MLVVLPELTLSLSIKQAMKFQPSCKQLPRYRKITEFLDNKTPCFCVCESTQIFIMEDLQARRGCVVHVSVLVCMCTELSDTDQ